MWQRQRGHLDVQATADTLGSWAWHAVLIGLAGAGPLFSQEVLEAMNEGCQHQAPIVMAMSNPTAKMECTAEEAQKYTDGRAVYASGSPQEDVLWEGRRIASTQANNMCAPPPPPSRPNPPALTKQIHTELHLHSALMELAPVRRQLRVF